MAITFKRDYVMITSSWGKAFIKSTMNGFKVYTTGEYLNREYVCTCLYLCGAIEKAKSVIA